MIPFNKPFVIDKEFKYIEDAISNKGILRGDGFYTKNVMSFWNKNLVVKKRY